MKILVTCYSQTGNTRQIAEAINQELAQSDTACLIMIDQIDADHLNTYDLLFIGSPIHARGLSAPVKVFLDSLPDHPDYKVAGFITHASSAYSKNGFESGILEIADICKSKSITYLDCFDCQGRLTPELHDAVRKAQNIEADEWAEKMAECDRHPNTEDEESAKEFARKVISRLNS